MPSATARLGQTDQIRDLMSPVSTIRSPPLRLRRVHLSTAIAALSYRLRGTLPDGTGAIDIRGPVDRTAQIMASLETFERELFERNRRAKNIEPPDAVAFDALVAVCTRATGGAAADPGDDPEADGAPTPPGSTASRRRT